MPLLAGILLALVASVAMLRPASAAEPAYQGRPVAAVLEELRSRGLGLIYNTEVVPGELRVLEEPRAGSPQQLVEEILKPHGLGLSRVAANLYSIVRLPTVVVEPREWPSAVATPADQPQEIVVSSSRYSIAALDSLSHAGFTRGQIESMPRLGDEALRAVQRLPGAASNGFSGLARIRGGEENESAISLNGLMLYEPFHLKNFLGPVSLLDSRLIGSIEAYTGGYTVEHGDRMSAVIDVRTLPGGERYKELGFSLFHTNALASGSFAGGKGGWLGSIRRSNLDLIAHVAEADNGKPSYFDGFGRATYELSPATRLAVNMLGSQDVVTANTSRESARIEYVNQYLWGELDHLSEGGTRSRLIASLTHVDNRRAGVVDDPDGVTGSVGDNRRFDVFGLRYEGAAKSAETDRFTHRWGGEARALDAGYRYRSEVLFGDEYLLPIISLPPSQRARQLEFDLEPSGESYAAWWSTRVRLLPKLTSEIGLRWDAQSYVNGSDRQMSPRLNLLFRPDGATNLRASWGRYFQAQGIHELQVEDGIGDFSAAQRSDHLILSAERELPLQTRLRVELYRKDYSRLHPRFENLFDPLVLMPELRADRVRLEPEAAHVRAVEFLLSRQDSGAWNGWLSYTLSQVLDRIDGREVARSWDQRHALQLGVDRTGVRWDFALTGSWHSGWPTTTLGVAGEGDAALVAIGPRNAERFTDFATIDLRLTRRFTLSRGELQVFAELTNALDRRNGCCRRYEAERSLDGGITLDSRTRPWLPLVPSAGVLFRF